MVRTRLLRRSSTPIRLIKARTVRSEETRLHLQDAHQRVMSVAAMQQQLQTSESDAIELGPYLTRLCETLAASMIGDRRPIFLQVHVKGGTACSSQAVSIGLIVTELVINAIKHAFPRDQADGTVVVAYDLAAPKWTLSVPTMELADRRVIHIGQTPAWVRS